jgi:enoyl-CoA hydratase/carnithine racemase
MLTCSGEIGGVVKITIDIPPSNLVGAEFIGGLIQVLPSLEQDPSVKVVVFQSNDPDFFLMHGDAQGLLDAPLADEPVVEPNLAASTFQRVTKAPFVTIGAIDGAARGGGCEFLSALDLRIGSPRVVIGQPEAALGILAGAGGTVRWPRIVGRASALELMLTARDIDANEALSLGWLQRIVSTDELEAEVDALARQIARMSRESIAAVKRIVDISLGDTEHALVAESAALARLMASGSHIEPLHRFLAAGGQQREVERAGMKSVIDAVLG